MSLLTANSLIVLPELFQITQSPLISHSLCGLKEHLVLEITHAEVLKSMAKITFTQLQQMY